MKLRFQQALATAHVVEADTVVIEDAMGNAVAVAIQHSPNVILASTIGQGDFQQLLLLAGVGNTIYVTQPEPKLLSSVRFDG